MGIAFDSHVFAWYDDGTVSSGTSTDLDKYRDPSPYSLPAGYSIGHIKDIGIAKSTNDGEIPWRQDSGGGCYKRENDGGLIITGVNSIGVSKQEGEEGSEHQVGVHPGHSRLDSGQRLMEL